jgi:hypothetical protein
MPATVEQLPSRGPARLLRSAWIPRLVAGVLIALATINLWGEAIYSLRGVHASGKVVEFHPTGARSRSIAALVDVVVPGTAPFRWEVEDTFGAQAWEEGGTVPLLCAHVHADHLSCVLDSWTDRFLFPSIVLAVGVAALWMVVRRLRAAGP